jgi:hypothetical protein
MGVRIVPFEESHIPAVRAFNARISQHVEELEERFGGAAHSRLPESVRPSWLPPVEGSNLREERFLAVEGDDVRGGYTLKHQEFGYRGSVDTMAGWHEPVSEGIIDKKYATVGLLMLRAAMQQEPHLVCTAMGGIETPLPRLLQAMRWHVSLAAFQFYVHQPYRLSRGLRHLRQNPLKALALDAAAFTGVAWAGMRAAQASRTLRRPRGPATRWTIEPRFGPWTDEVWESAQPHYSLAAVRTADVMNRLFPNPDERFGHDLGPCYVILRVQSGGATVGWALVMRLQMRDDSHFGNLHVGSIVDCFAAPDDAPAVVATATEYLEAEGVHLTYTNQFSSAWKEAFKGGGYLSGPSNYGLALSPASAGRLDPLEENLPSIHITRSDGEGPVHRRTLVTATPLRPTVTTP